MAAEVGSLVLFPTPIFLLNFGPEACIYSRQTLVPNLLLVNKELDQIALEQWNPELSLAVKLRGEAVLPALWFCFFRRDCPFVFVVL